MNRYFTAKNAIERRELTAKNAKWTKEEERRGNTEKNETNV